MIQVWRLIQTSAWFQLNKSKYFPSSSKLPFQREAKGEAIDMKMTFHSHANSLSSQERVGIYLRFDRDGFWNSEMASVIYASSEGKL